MQRITAQAFRAQMPLGTHWRRGMSCREAECAAFVNPTGWRTWVPVGSGKEALLRQHIKARGWRCTEEVVGNQRFFVFSGGTPCLNDGRHSRQLERDANLTHIDRDTRTVTPMQRTSWFDRWAEHLDRLARQRGA